MIDTFFDFTSELPNYWEGFWERRDGLGGGGTDPDKTSLTLREYHRILWSKKLPNGELMNLEKGDQYTYLKWRDLRLASDAIIVELRYHRYRWVIDEVDKRLGDYKTFYENLIRRGYTIGGTIIFPQHTGSINQNRGTNRKISDRWDLTMECIRRFYCGEKSPLSETLERDREFFNLFVDFKGYVDYFFLQDCVSEDYSEVDVWVGDASFRKCGLPETVNDYFEFIRKEHEFLDKRNQRINEYVQANKL